MAEGPEGAPAVSGPGRAVGVELRSRAVAAVLQEGMSMAAAARRFGLGERNVSCWVKRFANAGMCGRTRGAGAPRWWRRSASGSSASWRRARRCPAGR